MRGSSLCLSLTFQCDFLEIEMSAFALMHAADAPLEKPMGLHSDGSIFRSCSGRISHGDGRCRETAVRHDLQSSTEVVAFMLRLVFPRDSFRAHLNGLRRTRSGQNSLLYDKCLTIIALSEHSSIAVGSLCSLFRLLFFRGEARVDKTGYEVLRMFFARK